MAQGTPAAVCYRETVLDADSTSWELVLRSRDGDFAQRAAFVERYGPALRRWLGRRWRRGGLVAHVDDAVQDVFLECFKLDGALARVERGERGTLRRYLHGVVRHVAARYERGAARNVRVSNSSSVDPDQAVNRGTTLSERIDRAWAQTLVRDAARELEARAEGLGEPARRRVAILRLRFHDGLPLREAAERLGVEADYVHHQFAKARREFRDAILVVLQRRHPTATAHELEQRVGELIDLLR
jgi:RNA polymerase sigma factor (sigma-70 family)